MTESTRELLLQNGLVPVITLNDPAKAPCLVKTLRGLGIDCAIIRGSARAVAEADKDFLALAEGELTEDMIDELDLTVVEVPADTDCPAKRTFLLAELQKMLNFRMVHIGLNCTDEAEAVANANAFDALFGWTTKIGNSSVFAGSFIECMKTKYLGKNGHIAVATNNVVRAVYHLEKMGVAFNYDTAKYKDGKLIVVYFKEEIGGFAVHFVEKK